MGAVKVTLSVLRTTAERQQELAGEFDKYLNEISTVRSYFSSLGSSSWSGIPDTCSKVSDKLLNCQNGMKNASGKLQEMIAQYEKSENTVLGISPVIVRTDAAGTASGMSQSDRFIADLKRQGYDVSGISNMDVTTYQYIMRTGQLPKNYSSGIKGLSQSEGYIEDLRRQGYDVSGITNMDTSTYLNIMKSRSLPETQTYNYYVEQSSQPKYIIDGSVIYYDSELLDNPEIESYLNKIIISDKDNEYGDKHKKIIYTDPDYDKCDFTTLMSIAGTSGTFYYGDYHEIKGDTSGHVEVWLNSGMVETAAEFGVFYNENGDVCFGAAGSVGADYYLVKVAGEKDWGTSGLGAGVEGSVEVLSAEGSLEGKLGYIDNKLNANLSASLQATAVEGSATGNITILGITFEAKATAGVGVGGHAAVGIVDSKAVFDVAVGAGPYVGLAVSVDPSGFCGAVEEGVEAIGWLCNEFWKWLTED